MNEQQDILIQTPSGVAAFPAGTDPRVIERVLAEQFPSTAVSHKPGDVTTRAASQATGIGSGKLMVSTGGGRGTGLDVRKSDRWAKENAPAIGASLAVTAGPAGLIPAVALAGAGGYGGARLRGDDHSTALTSGALQGGLEAGTRGVSKLVGAVAPPLYRAAIPKAVQDKFAQSNLAGEGLRNRVVLGTRGGVDAAERAGARAGQRMEAATPSVPTLTAQDVQSAFKPKYNKALVGGKNDRAKEISAHVRQSMEEIGPDPMSGTAQLARKEFLEQEGKAAMGAHNPNMAAVNPQLANIERKTIAKNLRRSPEMATALNEAQAAVGLKRAAGATEHSSLVNRLAHGGAWNAMRSPAGFSGAAIGINELANLPWAQLIRMAQMSQLRDEE